MVKPIESICIDCGGRSTALRCRHCNGFRQKFLSAYSNAAEDAWLLDLIDSRQLHPRQLAVQEGISRQSAERRVATTRARQEAIHGIRLVCGVSCWCGFRALGDSDDPEWVHTEECADHTRMLKLFLVTQAINGGVPYV